MIDVECLDHVAVAVRDVAATAAWLTGHLGLLERFAGLWQNGPTMVGAGEASIALIEVTSDRPPGLLHLAFRVGATALAEAGEELERSGTPFRRADHGITQSIYLAGPAGLEIELTTYTKENEMADPAGVVTRMVERIFNAKDLAAADQLVAEDIVDHSGFPGQPPGREGMKQRWAGMFAAFPDFHITVDDLLVDGERVAMRATGRGHHEGAFAGIPPTGREIVFTEINISRVVGGRMVEHWAERGTLAVMEQLQAATGA
jgi:predicted ester cyclase/catechol 2,3-dioxygenase-like lactoylglutathione lyase family enzyme